MSDDCSECKKPITDKKRVRYIRSRKVCEDCFDDLLVSEQDDQSNDRYKTTA